jgi:hypothetical protein
MRLIEETKSRFDEPKAGLLFRDAQVKDER